MQQPQPETVTLDDILITEELSQRSPRPPNLQAENQAMRSLAQQMARDSQSLMQTLADTALELCGAGTAGVSLLETTPDGEEIFRWVVLAGTLAHHVGGSTPRNFSSCGVCLDRGTPVLFSHPERYFTYFQEAHTPVVEGLVVPLVADDHALGTIWTMSHDEQRQFDAEDVGIMTSLADFTAAALLLNQRQTSELMAVNAALEATVEEHRQAEAQLRALISNLPGGAAFVVDRDLRYLLAEGEALAIAGFKPKDLVGKTISEAMPPELVPTYEALYRQCLAGEPFDREHNAHDRTYISRGTPLRSANGDVNGVLAISYDITDRKAAEAALRESEAKYRLLFNSMDEGYFLCEVIFNENDQPIDLLYIDENLAATRMAGQSFRGRRLRDIDPNYEEYWYEIFGRVAQIGQGERLERYAEPDKRWYDFYVFKVGNEESRQVAVVFSDITDRKQAEAQLRRAAEVDAFRVKLSDALRSLSDPIEIQAEACRILGEHLGVDRAYYVEVNEVESYARVNQDYLRGDSPSLVGVFRLVDYGWIVPHLRRGETIVVTDAEYADIIPEAERAAMVVVRIAAHISLPLVKAGTLVGALCVTEAEPRQWLEVEIELVRETAERIWADIQRTNAEAALRKSEEQFRILVTASSNIIYRMSADWHEMRNLEGKNVLVSTENPSQTWIEAYIPPSEQLRVWTAIQESIRTKSTFELEHQVIQQDGSIGWTFSRAIPILNEQGEILEWFGAASDVTARKQAEANQIQLIREQAAREEERQRAESLAELDRAKTAFFSNVSHEFRTPLTLILAPLQDALKSVDEGERRSGGVGEIISNSPHHPITPSSLKEQLQLVHRNSLRLLKLVNTLLDFSRIEAGRMEAVYEPTDLATFTADLASVFRSAIERAGLRLIVDCSLLPEPVYVDREMWEKIVLNLLSNALKFTFEGAITVRLRPAAGNQAILQIQDTGTGISPEHLPHLFERFYQVRGTQARTHEGSGIGLALVHELVQLHGGTIEVSSTMEEGTCFAIALPFGTEHLPSERLRRGETVRLLVEGDRSQPTRTLASTAIGASSYVEEAERWLPKENGKAERTEEGVASSASLTAGPDGLAAGLDGLTAHPDGLTAGPDGLATHPDGLTAHPDGLTAVLDGLAAGPDGLAAGPDGLATHPDNLATGPDGLTAHPDGLTARPDSLDPATSDVSSARVLLVDDNADMREYLTRILSEHVQVEAVADGVTALAAAQERVPDLILSDIMMPGLDGFELLQSLRTDPRTKDVPIILLSARAGEEAIVEGLEAGADDYLIKPFSAQELMSRIKAHLQREHQRKEALRQEQTSSRQKDELLSIVSHELNAPLVAILGWTRLLRANPPTLPMLMKSLDIIERNATVQAKLIQDLLDISRITADKLHVSLQPVDLEAVIETAIATIAQTAAAKRIDLIWQSTQQSTDPVVVMGDRDRLQQVICNLLSNAVKFTPAGGEVTIRLGRVMGNRSLAMDQEPNPRPTTDHPLPIPNSPSPMAAFTQITVTDTGVGIPADSLPHIFDRFYQVKTSESAKGLGLGLAIAHHLVELHNGTIDAESAGTGQGATLIVRLPLLQPIARDQ